jgi:hypothetical protein
MRLFLIFIIVLLSSCHHPEVVTKAKYNRLADSLTTINTNLQKQITVLNDSIVGLNARQVLSSEQFINLYKYARLNKYYQICKRNPVQWKYYKGWSIRVFEQ